MRRQLKLYVQRQLANAMEVVSNEGSNQVYLSIYLSIYLHLSIYLYTSVCIKPTPWRLSATKGPTR